MSKVFNNLASECSKKVTNTYSSSFSSATRMLSPSIQGDIHNIYGFVRFADEIVDTFETDEKEFLLDKFEWDFHEAMKLEISLNPIIHSFVGTVKKYDIDIELVNAFLKSMRMDLNKTDYQTIHEYNEYIYGSADVVGLMCLKIFVNGDQKKYDELKGSAMRLGSAFQKVNFLRDLKSDVEILNRSYFPHVNLRNLDTVSKDSIIKEIEEDFHEAYKGIIKLPASSKFGVYTAFIFYKQLLYKLKSTPAPKIMDTRIRVSDPLKIGLLIKSYVDVKFNLV